MWWNKSLKTPKNGINREEVTAEVMEIRDGLSGFDHHSAFEQLLKKKSVAVVGPAKTVLGSKQGKFIDSFDVVARFNDAFEYLPFGPRLAEDIGTRADILYCNQVILRKNILNAQEISRERFIRLCRQGGIKFLVCTNNSLSFEETGKAGSNCDEHDRNVIDGLKRLLRDHGLRTDLRIVQAASRLLNRWLQGNWGRTGFIALLDLLMYDITHLYVAGMTFYHAGGHLFSTGSSELHPLKNRDGTWANDSSGRGHDSYLELDVMRVLFRCFRKKMDVDRDLLMLLEAESRGPDPS